MSETMGLGKIELSELQKSILDETVESLKSNGQGAIHLFTGGGKSYIAHEIIKDYYADKKVIWLYPGLTLDLYMNTKVIGDLPNVIPMMYSSLKSQENYIKERLNGSIDLIIMDECPRALAKLTYPIIKDIIDTTGADILAMSATPIRDFTDIETNNDKIQGRLNSFDILVPNAVYNCYDNGWAIKNGVMAPFEYVMCPLSISPRIFSEADKLKELLGFNSELTKMVDGQLEIISKYNNSFEDNLLNTLTEKLSDSSSEGSKHFIYVNRIATIEGIKDTIHEVFSKVYPSKNINVYTCYDGLKESNENQEKFLRKPIDGEVDILITVNKGGEGLHPENTKSVIMLRKTNSHAKWIQQSNRATAPVEFAQGEGAVVFDFVGNIERVGDISTYMGDMVKDFETYVNNDEKAALGDSIKANADEIRAVVTLSSNELTEALSQLDSLMNLDSFTIKLDRVIMAVKSSEKKFNSIGETLKNSKDYNLRKWFKQAQDEFLSKTMEVNRRSLFIERLGLKAYCRETTSNADIEYMKSIIQLGEVLKEREFNVDKLAKQSNVYKILSELRYRYFITGLQVNIRELARDLAIDIEGGGEWYLDTLKEKLPKFYANYKTLRRALATCRTKIESESLSEDSWTKVRAHYDYMSYLYTRNIERLVLKNLGVEYKDVLNFMQISSKDKFRGKDLVTKHILIRTKKISIESEQDFFSTAGRLKQGLSKYELFILKSMKYSSVSDFKNTLCNCGPWGFAYKTVLKEVDLDKAYKALQSIWAYNSLKLTKMQKELLDSDEFLTAMIKIVRDVSDARKMEVFKSLYNLNKSNIMAAKCIAKCTNISPKAVLLKYLPIPARQLFEETIDLKRSPDNIGKRIKYIMSDSNTVNMIGACAEFELLQGIGGNFIQDLYAKSKNKIDGRVIRGMKYGYDAKLVNTMLVFNGYDIDDPYGYNLEV